MFEAPSQEVALQLGRIALMVQHEELIFGSRAVFWMCIGCPHDLDPVVPDDDPWEPE